MKIQHFAKMRAMESAYASTNSQLVDQLLASEQGDSIREKLLTKRLQFDCSPQLYERVESVCALLGSTKREVLEMIVSGGCDFAEKVFMESFKDVHGEEFTTVYAANEVQS